MHYYFSNLGNLNIQKKITNLRRLRAFNITKITPSHTEILTKLLNKIKYIFQCDLNNSLLLNLNVMIQVLKMT